MAGLGMVLSGGGARGAYEAGVTSWLLDEWAREGSAPRLQSVSGTSVGAIHAAALAAFIHDPQGAAKEIDRVWATLAMDQILRFGPAQWVRASRLLLGGSKPGGLFDARSLRGLVKRAIPWDRISENLGTGRIGALTVTATHVPTGRPTVFFEAASGIAPPNGLGNRVMIKRGPIGLPHVLASASIPLVFPPVELAGELYCDGGLRMNTPMEPAIRLGADRLFVVGLNTVREDQGVPELGAGRYPGASFLIGKVLNAFLLDHVSQDLDHLQHLNQIVRDGREAFGERFDLEMSRVAAHRGDAALREIHALVIRPSEDLGVLAAERLKKESFRLRRGMFGYALLRILDAGEGTGSDLASYLLFDSGYAKALHSLGREDAANAGDRIRAFFGAGAH